MPWVAWLDARRDACERGPAAAQRLRLRVAAAAELSSSRPACRSSFLNMLIPLVAAADRARRRALGLRDGEVLRRHLPRPAARGQPRCTPAIARQRGSASALVWLALGCVALGLLPVQFIQLIDPVDAPARRRPGSAARRGRAGGCSCRSTSSGASYSPVDRAARPRRRCVRADVPARAPALPRAPAPRPRLGLRLSLADAAHAGHGRRLRPADPADLRAVLPHRARAAVAVRPRAASIASSSAIISGTGSTCRSRARSSASSRWIGQLQQGRISVYLTLQLRHADRRFSSWSMR